MMSLLIVYISTLLQTFFKSNSTPYCWKPYLTFSSLTQLFKFLADTNQISVTRTVNMPKIYAVGRYRLYWSTLPNTGQYEPITLS